MKIVKNRLWNLDDIHDLLDLQKTSLCKIFKTIYTFSLNFIPGNNSASKKSSLSPKVTLPAEKTSETRLYDICKLKSRKYLKYIIWIYTYYIHIYNWEGWIWIWIWIWIMDMDNGYGSGYGYGYGLNITMDKCMQYYSNK